MASYFVCCIVCFAQLFLWPQCIPRRQALRDLLMHTKVSIYREINIHTVGVILWNILRKQVAIHCYLFITEFIICWLFFLFFCNNRFLCFLTLKHHLCVEQFCCFVRRDVTSSVDEILWGIKFPAVVLTVCNMVSGNSCGFIQTVMWLNEDFVDTVMNLSYNEWIVRIVRCSQFVEQNYHCSYIG